MTKKSQRELVNEALGDVVRGIGAALKATATALAPQTAGNVGKLVKTGSDIVNAYTLKQPIGFVKNELNERYYKTFNLKTLKDFKEFQLKDESVKSGIKGAPKTNRIGVEFTAQRFNTAQIPGSPSPTKPLSYEKFYAIVVRGPKGLEMEVRDSNNRIVRGEKEHKSTDKLKWDTSLRDAGLDPTPKFIHIIAWLTSKNIDRQVRSITGKDIRKIVTDIIKTKTPGATVSDDYDLTSDDMNGLKEYFTKDVRLFEYTQTDLIKRLKIMVESLPYKHED